MNTRIQTYTNEVAEITKKIVRDNMPEPYRITIERCDMVMPDFIVERFTNVSQTMEQEYMKSYTKCKRKEATSVIFISKWDESLDRWADVRHIWVKSK